MQAPTPAVEFMRTVVLPCPENAVFLWSSDTLAITVFLVTLLTLNLIPRRQDAAIDVPFVADPFPDIL